MAGPRGAGWPTLWRMRPLLLAALLCSAPALAQEAGVWKGYVQGFVAHPRPFQGPWASGRRPPSQPRDAEALLAERLLWQQFLVQQYVLQLAAQQQVLEARQLHLAEQQVQREQLAAQELAERAQALAEREQALAQLAAQPRAPPAPPPAPPPPAPVAVAPPAPPPAPTTLEAPRPLEAAPGPREKGPEVHRWVDEEGTIHYSTLRKGEKRLPR